MKTKKLIKEAIKKAKLFTKEELLYFKNWLYIRKESKAAKLNKRKQEKD